MNNDGERTLRSFSKPINLAAVFGPGWATARGDVFAVAEFVDSVAHYKLCDREHLAALRPADPFMLQTTVTQREWPPPENFDEVQAERNINK